MNLIQEPRLSDFDFCPYIISESIRYEYFFAADLNFHELDELLKKGWRKFGFYYFRPQCNSCRKCIPLRIVAKKFKPTKSQRRILKIGSEIEIKFRPLRYRDQIYQIYSDHSEKRFNKKADYENFINTFYINSCPSFQSEYFLKDELIAVGFIDKSSASLSSVYFIYKTDYSKYSLGTLSILKEVEHAASLGFDYYYLGYYIAENRSMEYKNRFHPNEKYDWENDFWKEEEMITPLY